MKRILKPFAVWTLTSCLTTLQFSSLAWGQQGAELRTTPRPTKTTDSLNDLATPSLLGVPLKGFMVDLGYARAQSEVQIKDVVGKAETTEDQVRTSVVGAITPSFFAGVSYGYKSSKSKTDFAVAGIGSISETNAEGVGDPTIGVGGRLNFSMVSVIGSLGYLISTGNAESQMKSSQLTEENGKKGGGQILPKLTVFTNRKSNIIFGGSASYTIKQDRKISAKDMSGFVFERREKGGNVFGLSAFVETPQTTHSVGLSLDYAKDEPTKRESLTTYDVQGSELLSLTGYGNLHLTQNLSLLPSASYHYYMNDKAFDTKLSSQSLYSGGLDLRLTF